MISSSSENRNLSSDPQTRNFWQYAFKRISDVNLNLYLIIFIGGIFLYLLFSSENALLEELSKAMIIITLLVLLRFLSPNSTNLK